MSSASISNDPGKSGTKAGPFAHRRAEEFLAFQNQVLELVATGAPLAQSMEALIRAIEAQAPGMLGSVLVLDPQGMHLRHCAAPNLPSEYCSAIDGVAIGPAVGSCGTAAFTKAPVFVADIDADPRWKDYRGLAAAHGLRACWSTPIFDPEHRVIGTFAMYYRHPGLPTPEHLRLTEIGTHIAALAICRDRTEAALREREAKLNEAQRVARMGYWERDLLADRITWSEGTCRIFDWIPNGTLSQAQLQEMIYPEDRQLQKEAFEAALRGGHLYDVEYRIVRPDGEVRFVHSRDEIAYDRSGNPVRMFGTVQDITERKQAELSVRESQQLLQLVLATLPVGVAVTDRDGNIVLTNAASKRIWSSIIVPGRERWEKSKGRWHDSGKSIAPEEWASVRALLRGETSLNELIDIETYDGQQKIMQNSAAPIRDAQGSIVGAVIVNEDVTESKRSEERLRQTQAELARVARWTMMGELTASIAHEINQPLAGVVANANACLRWLSAARPNIVEASKAVRRIARDGRRAGDVIARVRALLQKGESVRQLVNLNHEIRTAVSLVQPELKRRTVSLQMELDQKLPRVLVDQVQLHQVLLNLVGNAVDSLAALPAGPRLLRIASDRPKRREVRVTVQDNGIGIDPQQAGRLFEPFYTTKPHGLGMGLTISRSIIDAHGGRLSAALNATGPGMTFEFTLPLRDGRKT